ncbi:Developmentally-regulated GTP-binding protein 2, partial [Eschrichtius robustus]|nr:Developmentally-regulated GTP-binding protein 2 [Eschrichtius robustus]
MPGLLKAPPAQRSEPIASGTALDVARPDSESRRAGRTRTPFSVGFRRTLICRRRRAGVRGAAAVCLACAPGSAAAMGILEKISEIEKEIARTQKNKATEYHLGLLKAKLAKYRAQLLEPSKSSSSKGEGFDVMKSGDARVALIGFPSVGKSTFLSLMTSTASEAASYEFTTLTCIPGVIEYKGANIQLLDLPGIIEGAAQEIFNAEVLFREDCSPDEFIDVIMGNRVYMPCLYVYNKIDQISMEEVDRLARKPDSVVI